MSEVYIYTHCKETRILSVLEGGHELKLASAISLEIKTLLIFMLRYEENKNHGHTAKKPKSSTRSMVLGDVLTTLKSPSKPYWACMEGLWSMSSIGSILIFMSWIILQLDIFKSRIREAWERIDQAHIQRLVESIPARLDACQHSEDGVQNIDLELSSYQIHYFFFSLYYLCSLGKLILKLYSSEYCMVGKK